jgi:hypothetical protein
MTTLKHIIFGRTLLYGYIDKHLPKIVTNKKNNFYIYNKNTKILKKRKYFQRVRILQSVADLSNNKADQIFLDNATVKALVVGYPSTTPYVYVALDKPRYWFWIIIGLIRRIKHKQIKIIGLRKLKQGKYFRIWLLIKNQKLYFRTTLSKKIGITALIKFLNKNNIKYVLLRDFNNLTSNKHKDFDFLVADKDYSFVKGYLDKNPGGISIDLWTESKPNFNGITYYAPTLAKKILDNSIKGEHGTKIPNKKYYLLSYIYHCLYHKGVNSGIPSTNKDIEFLKIPNNKYLKTIRLLTKDLKINIGGTMEELDEFLASKGWRPKIDTLSKIAVHNKWVKKKYIKKNGDLFPFSVFILRQHAKDNLIIHLIKNFINKNGCKILNYNSLTGNIRKNVTVNLRGGNWKDHKFLDKTKKFEPSYAMIVYNLDSFDNNKFANLKEKIRKNFDNNSDPSVVHSTDTEDEFWNYIEYCFPKKIDFLKKKILKMNKKKVYVSIFKKIDIWIYKIKHSSISLIKNKIIKLISI